jgi:hypothetical protein
MRRHLVVPAPWRGIRSSGRRGQALAEMAIVLPVLLILVFGIIEMASAWRTFQIVTNGAREGARVAILPNANTDRVIERVEEHLDAGRLTRDDREIIVQCWENGVLIQDGGICEGMPRTGREAVIRVRYPFRFLLLGAVSQLGCGSSCGPSFGEIIIASTSTMRIE